MTTDDSRSRPRVRSASKAVVRYIHRLGLQPGDRLVDQQELRSELGYSNDSLTPAMRELSRMGVLKRKRGRGTEVVSLDAADPSLWSVGVPVYGSSFVPGDLFYPHLSHAIQVNLRKQGFASTLCPSTRGTFRAAHGLDDLPELRALHERDELDGIIAPLMLAPDVIEWARAQMLPLCGVSFDRFHGLSGVYLSLRDMVCDAAGLLVGQGCERVAMVCPAPPRKGFTHAEGFDRARQYFGDPILPEPLAAGNGVEAGRAIAEQLLQTPADDRPDGLIITSDALAMGLTAGLVEAADYRPRLAVQTKREVPIALPWPAFCFELRIETLVEMAVGMLLERLVNPEVPDETRECSPVLVGLRPGDPTASSPAEKSAHTSADAASS